MKPKNWYEKYGKKRYGEPLNEDTVFFYGYKEPLVKFDGGFGYKGVLSYNKDKDKVQCHFCGYAFRTLNSHLKIHGLTVKEYKIKTGLANTTALIGEGTRIKLLDRPRYDSLKALKKAHKNRKLALSKGLKDPNVPEDRKARLEFYNKKGSCPDQLLDKIRKTIKSYGRVPTQKEFHKFNGGRFIGSIYRTFGNWRNALKLINKKPEKRGNLPYSREELLEAMKMFYKVNGRTPRWSDFRRGLLPTYELYLKHFGGLNKAREEAGVPILIPVANRKWEEVLHIIK